MYYLLQLLSKTKYLKREDESWMGFLYGKITVKIANEEMQREILGDCLEKENQSIHYLLQLLSKTKSLKIEDKWLIGFLYIYIYIKIKN